MTTKKAASATSEEAPAPIEQHADAAPASAADRIDMNDPTRPGHEVVTEALGMAADADD
ncbi:hypothetical protein GCM10007897_15070 [Sphingobium jiangsuense]|uniref:Uncharacterized protein n=1 Tax=Sphingobium jiangsuense TaxID=870476 RepID=A0A7W6FNQ2_9SPHN|nr:hypothetical protein [Sphingobium jiangsuense]MBB3925048.1 hypothetical protein [Sphingobium jiangsuense]GLT00123.1 hypothetical protein GCM10007897_15070 [Sphingobium jiangsuense]